MAPGLSFDKVLLVLVFLRYIGLMNAAVWLGAAVFYTVLVEPAFSSDPMLKLLFRPRAGAAGFLLADRFFLLQYVCGGIALAHLAAESLYTGRFFRRRSFYFASAILVVAILAGTWLQPKLQGLHLDIHGVLSSPEQRDRGQRLFPLWHVVFQFFNGLVVCGLLVYVWDVTGSGTTSRFGSGTKFRG